MIPKITPEQFGAMLKEGRRRSGLSQLQLAQIVGMDRPYLCRIENGRVNPNSLSFGLVMSLLDALGIADNLFSPAVDYSNLPGFSQFLEENAIAPDDARMLSGIAYRGNTAKNATEWLVLYKALRGILSPDDKILGE